MNMRIETISGIREFNRFYTNIMGLIDEHILNTGYSLTEARILHELYETGSCTANALSLKLNIDKSYLSRIYKKFEESGLILKEISNDDGRAQLVKLTQKGLKTIKSLIEKSNIQVEKLLAPLCDEECAEINSAMEVIKKYFTKAENICIRPFKNEDIEFVIRRHIEIYSEEYGLTTDIWKNYVKEGVQQLADNFDSNKDCMYIIDYKGVPSGCIAITHTDAKTAQLRFFFIDASLRKMGLGRRMMELAIDFCREKKYEQVFLWTFSGLEAARYLYSKYGFNITQTHENNEWGKAIIEEKWELNL